MVLYEFDFLSSDSNCCTSKLACTITGKETDAAKDPLRSGKQYHVSLRYNQNVLTKYSLKKFQINFIEKFRNGIIFVCLNFITSEPYGFFNAKSFPNYSIRTHTCTCK